MKKMILTSGVVLLFLCVSFIQVNADQFTANVKYDRQDTAPAGELVFKCFLTGLCNLNVKQGTEVDWKFKGLSDDVYIGATITGEWGGTSFIESIVRGTFNFAEGETYQVTILLATNMFTSFDIGNEHPYITPEGGKIVVSGWGAKVYLLS